MGRTNVSRVGSSCFDFKCELCRVGAKVHTAKVLALISEMSFYGVSAKSRGAEVAVLISNTSFYGAVAKSCNREIRNETKKRHPTESSVLKLDAATTYPPGG